MCTSFTRAILRRPGAGYACGITTSDLGAPDLSLALAQHQAYAQALSGLGLALTILPADEVYPDGTFTEDGAFVTARGAIITRLGAASRRGESLAIAETLKCQFADLGEIVSPGTVDGGDVCETEDLVLIGVGTRTNAAGAAQLAGWLADRDRASEVVDIRGFTRLLHLKTGMSYLGDGRIAVAPDIADLPALARFERVVLTPAEAYAANCIRVNDKVLVAAGFPRFAGRLDQLGYTPLLLAMSEYQKMDGGLSCLSLRF